ncbi:hypothetical protein COW99_02965 [Candidatus Roizmanbacteria bacterium CG22_combo_CG10-13_8_21_14_all_38_20]|uniref:Prepilin-type N-terminal cleavage/methylation domain-containing protein n=1 Tax=Candidatus Roizmanbacteria bacterium CG22_combo_CG10-13_8_21_14_all_38_20 TaxID=1974862 RepID=A0A2H0BV84_9BACT|nr:type II secretion system protein [Candidatus Microgenomates bacterium]PIP61585.1 MAG: hypothetical protein COW99_02965 [Candidatus Roizmanbacteria bacterium CG22_combo_CG10-13_8_21_14_all_38_20]PJC30592.1 MAG: hypothetical protein CO050_05775 [Candidatus Roizmanbacteria bacterium CG_4_9_14_0_2_um_filter_38_17]
MKLTGFTLIELIIVIGIMSILTWQGLANYGAFIKKQVVQEQGKDFVSILRKAQSDANTGYKPSATCGASDSLVGYRVNGVASTNTYTVSAICSDGVETLQKSYEFDSRIELSTNFDLTFLSPYGNSNNNYTICIAHAQDSSIKNAIVSVTTGGGIELTAAACPY